MLKPWPFQEGSLVLSTLNFCRTRSRSGQAPCTSFILEVQATFPNLPAAAPAQSTSTLRSEKVDSCGGRSDPQVVFSAQLASSPAPATQCLMTLGLYDPQEMGPGHQDELARGPGLQLMVGKK